MKDKKYPNAPAALVEGNHGYRWRVTCCPICGQQHFHGGGPLAGDPRTWLGHRVAHCRGMDSSGYILTDIDPVGTATTLACRNKKSKK